MSADSRFSVSLARAAIDFEDLHAVRDTVFVHEQQVPLELERDTLDAQSTHVIARDNEGRAIGTGRMTPQRSIGRMAVLPAWRGRGVGDALLHVLLQQARQSGWPAVTLHAQVSAIDFYTRHGFLPFEARFEEAGIQHQSMRLQLDGIAAISGRQAGIAAVVALASAARRSLQIYSRDLDPGLLDTSPVIEALRRFGTAGRGNQTCILLHDAAVAQRAHAPLIPLAQRLPSAFAFREVVDAADRAYPSAFIANDAGGYYFRSLGQDFRGEAEWHAPGRASRLREYFQAAWERARPIGEFRALGL